MGYLIIMSQAIVEASRQSIIGPDGTPLVEDEEDLEDGSGEVSVGCSFQLFMLRELEPSLAERWAEVSQSADTSTHKRKQRDVFCVYVCLSMCAVHAGQAGAGDGHAVPPSGRLPHPVSCRREQAEHQLRQRAQRHRLRPGDEIDQASVYVIVREREMSDRQGSLK